MFLTISLPEIITLGAGVFIAAYTGLDFDPAFHSNRLWRLQLVGVISAIVSMIAAMQIEFMLPMQKYTGFIYAAGVISFGSWMVGQYRAQLDRAVLNDGKRRMVLREFTRANHIRIMWMLIIIAGIGAFPSLAAWLAPLKDRLLSWIRGLFGASSSQKPPLTPEMPNEPMNLPDELRAPPSEPSLIWEILGWIVLEQPLLSFYGFWSDWAEPLWKNWRNVSKDCYSLCRKGKNRKQSMSISANRWKYLRRCVSDGSAKGASSESG